MIEHLKELLIKFTSGMDAVAIAFMTSLLFIGVIHLLDDKIYNTIKIVLKGIGEILAILVVTPVTVIIISLDILIQAVTIILTVITGITTLIMRLLKLIKELLHDLSTYIVNNFGEETK